MLLSAISLALLIISSFSFTYMKPLDTISGPETKIPAFISTDALDVPFTDGIRQVEYMRFQERFRLVRVRYFSDSAGRKKLGTGAEGDADHRHEQTEPEGHGKEMHGGN